MKKINKLFLIGLVAFLSLFLVSGCNENENHNEDDLVETENVESEVFDQTTFMQTIMPNLQYMQSCEQELFGADVDFESTYVALYTYENEEYKFAKLIPTNEELPEGYVEDPAAALYYPVTNFSSIQELKDNAQNFILEAKIPNLDLLEYDFLEHEGSLYLCRGGRGYGSEVCDLDTLEYVGEENGLQVVKVDYFFFDEKTGTGKIYFENIDGNWTITDISLETAN